MPSWLLILHYGGFDMAEFQSMTLAKV